MLENLNNEQRLAVETTEGPVLVLSGAGTGKTRVLTTRIAYILNVGLAAPWNILALTFTNRAANEMKTRIAGLSADGARWRATDLWCGTFHSICLRILRANSDAAGLRHDFLVYGEDDQKQVIKDVLADNGGARATPGELIERFSAIKDKGLVALSNTDRLYVAYNNALAGLGAVDFGDIILKVLQLFDTHPEILTRYQRQFKYILVDEFQDTNAAQMQLLEMLTRGVEYPNICCVGDDDQSIYSWRGAEIKNILDFDKNFRDAQIIRLETNYRSTANILGAANSLIRHNDGRLGKDLRAAMDDAAMAEPVYVITVGNDLEEASFIADTILRNGGDLKNYAVLMRAGSLSRILEEEFARRQIPFRLVGATKFYDRAEIRDAIAYVRLMAHPFDDVSFLRIISKPRRGIGPGAIDKIRATGAPFLMDGLRRAALPGKARVGADEFLDAFDFDWAGMSPRDAAQMLLERAGYMKMWRESKDTDAHERLDNIKELINGVIAKFDTVDDFLEQAALMTADDDTAADASNAVCVMTIHAAKGLEFDTVFLPGWEEGIFPNDKAIAEGALEEERRLAYVAITRARRRAVITNAVSRMVFGSRQYNSPSRFIDEMDERFLEMPGAAPRRVYREGAPSRDVRVRARRQSRPVTMVGKLVEHSQMGRGTVIAENGNVLTVAFGGRGIKNVMRDFVTLV